MRNVMENPVLVCLENAKREGRSVLLEHEGYALLRELGIGVPRSVFIRSSEEAVHMNLHIFPSTRLVVKVVSPKILHKTEVEGVRIVPRERSYVAGAVQQMEEKLAHPELAGFLVSEFVDHDTALGGELLLSMRWTPDFGPLVFLGAGGQGAEYLSGNLQPGREMVIVSPDFASDREVQTAMQDKMVVPFVTGRVRGGRMRMSECDLVAMLRRLLSFASVHMPERVTELEINPLVLTERGPVALDVLCRTGIPNGHAYPERPLSRLKNLLHPESIALIGVSEKMNPGRIMLQNILKQGFPKEKIRVIKPGREELDGCVCVPDLASVKEPVDLLILSVDAPQVPEILDHVVSRHKAESLIMISGGLGEREGTSDLQDQIRRLITASRYTPWQGPVLNGGNCLGIRSIPGKYDTLFIPSHKLRFPDAPPAPVAVISQSGAYMVAAASKLSSLNPRYLVSAGNQTDLTVGDYLSYLKDDPEVRLFACYVEGFRPLDGLKWIRAAKEITASGRTVLLYRAGKTPAGAAATASHTASIAGDYSVTRELARQAGVMIAESLADFTDLIRLFCLLEHKQVSGRNVAAVSNAGFECVAMADHLGRFSLAKLSPYSTDRLSALLQAARIAGVVDVRNPLDVTPIMDDRGYESVVRTMLEDEGVDVGVVGCVPLTGRLQTLPSGAGHPENIVASESVASALIRVFHELPKAWVAVVDAGSLYDPMVDLLEKYGVPVFRSADRALRLFDMYCTERLRKP